QRGRVPGEQGVGQGGFAGVLDAVRQDVHRDQPDQGQSAGGVDAEQSLLRWCGDGGRGRRGGTAGTVVLHEGGLPVLVLGTAVDGVGCRGQDRASSAGAPARRTAAWVSASVIR